jgi:predicted ATPase
MAISRISLNSGDIPLAPLTVIFGRNNAGKSSILQSLLILRQTLDSPEYGPRLDLRGPLYAAGSYADIVHQHRSRENVLMSFDVLHAGRSEPASVELEFASEEPQPPRLVRLRIQNQIAPPVEIRRGPGRGGPYEMCIAAESQGTEAKALFRFPESGFFPLIGPEPLRVGRPSLKREEARKSARQVLEDLESALRTMRTVGAFRQQPLRRYEYLGRAFPSADITGRAVVDALIEDAMRRTKQRGELLRGVNRWLKAVGRVRILALRRISRSARIYEVRVKDADSQRWANFADVGFGIGQALPVLVEGLRTPPEAQFMVQEPEIHLHPDAQLHMADFLVSLARSGRRVVVETHSENLLLRIRRRILGNPRSSLRLKPSEVSIIYVRKTTGGTSEAIALPVDDLAQIARWPTGFMEEATEERMAIMKRLAESSSRKG